MEEDWASNAEESEEGGVSGAAGWVVGAVTAGAVDEGSTGRGCEEEEGTMMEATESVGDAWKTGTRVVATAEPDEGGCWKNSPPFLEVVGAVVSGVASGEAEVSTCWTLNCSAGAEVVEASALLLITVVGGTLNCWEGAEAVKVAALLTISLLLMTVVEAVETVTGMEEGSGGGGEGERVESSQAVIQPS